MSKSAIAAYTIVFSAAALGAIYGWLHWRDMKRQATFIGNSGEEVVGGLLGYVIDRIGSPWFDILFITSWSGFGVAIVAIPIGLTAFAWNLRKVRKTNARFELTKKKLHRELSNHQSED